MEKVWKIGSRYGSQGDILDVFWKYQVVFAGAGVERILQQVKQGHLIAVSSGFRVVAIAKVLTDATSVKNLGLHESDSARFDGAVGSRVRLITLNETDRFDYKERRAFVSANRIADTVRELYERYLNAFEIRSKVFCLLGDQHLDSGVHSLLGGETVKYVIPIYQRPYSWQTSHLQRLVGDLKRGFDEKSPVFAGPIQLSFPIPIDWKQNAYLQEVIDGQQRLTTLRLLIKLLGDQDQSPNQTIHDDWLKTMVNEGQQQKHLEAALNCDLSVVDQIQEERETNPYLNNLAILQQVLEDNDIVPVKDMSDDDRSASYGEFLDYLLSSIRLVAVETQAGLSKTLQVFNTINTAGLDLGGADLFKIRFYEYLTKDNRGDEAAFKSISKLYGLIDEKNKALGTNVCSMADILELLKYKTIVSTKLGNYLWRDGTDTFFERYFDTAIGVRDWPGYSKAKEGKLRISTIRVLIDARYAFHEARKSFRPEAACCMHFIWRSRYARFWLIPILFMAKYDEPVSRRYLEELVVELAKLFIVYSTIFRKRINGIVNFLLNVMEKIEQEFDVGQLLTEIRAKTEEQRDAFINEIKGTLAFNSKGKELVCRLSAMLDEKDSSTASELEEKLFDWQLDIEHIQPVNNKEGERREEIWKEWAKDLHAIGNLMVLERNKNRSIGNLPLNEKVGGYQLSAFQTVKLLAAEVGEAKDYSLLMSQDRAKRESQKVGRYLFQ